MVMILTRDRRNAHLNWCTYGWNGTVFTTPYIDWGKWALTLIERQVCWHGVRRQSARHSYRCWMGHGWGRKRLMFRSVRLSVVARWTGAHLSSLLCFVAVGWTIMPVQSPMLAISTPFINTVVVFATWGTSTRPNEAMSVIILFDFSHSLSWSLLQSLSPDLCHSLSARLCMVSVLYPSCTWVLAPHNTAVQCGGETVWMTVRKDRFLFLISHQWLPNPCVSRPGGGMPSVPDTILPRLEGTSGGKSGRHPGSLGGFKTPTSFNLGYFLSSKQLQIPRETGKNWIHGSERSHHLSGTSCYMIESIKGATWLRSMTRSGNNSGPKCTPLGMRRHPTVVNFLSTGSQLGTDNSLLTNRLLATMQTHGLKGHKMSFWKDWRCSYIRGLCNTIWGVRGKSHMPAIVPYEHHVRPALRWCLIMLRVENHMDLGNHHIDRVYTP